MASSAFLAGPEASKYREEVAKFCDNLKASLLSCVDSGRHIYIKIKSDFEKVVLGNGLLADASYEGCTYTIAMDRPAAVRAARRTE